jgi:alpha-L-rhamnosidase
MKLSTRLSLRLKITNLLNNKSLNMNLKSIFFISAMLTTTTSYAQYYSGQQENWLKKAELCKPQIKTTIHHPVSEVEIIKDADAFQGYKAVKTGDINSLYTESFKKKKEVIIDFGEHLVGNVSLKLKDIGLMQDAMLRFKVTFGEVPSDLALPIEPYTGSLSRGWLQDFTFDVSYNGTYTFNRRIAARYMKIEAIGTSIYSDFCFDNITFKATTSAGESKIKLADSTPQIFKDIALKSEKTLKDCMQGVFEDGPKRDQRLWLGDLYLEALANSASFKEYNLTKRCLYLFAGLANPQNGLLFSNLVEYPQPHAQKTFFVDYALSYMLTLYDYYKATGDTETATELWPVAKRQIDAVLEHAIDKNYLYSNLDYQFKDMIISTVFFDWSPGNLDKHAAIQAYLTYVMDRSYEFAKEIGKVEDVKKYQSISNKLRAAGRKAYWDAKDNIIISGDKKQMSYICTSWAILGNLINTKEARLALKNVMNDKDAITPGTPYANHFLVAAMLHCGMNKEAKRYVEDYWGGMVKLGADTFWEYYVPGNQFFSAYNNYTLLNSYCHGWSCTPVYFITKYPEIFQR